MHEVLGMGAAKAVNRWRQQALAVSRALPAPRFPSCTIIASGGACHVLPESLPMPKDIQFWSYYVPP